MYWLEKLSKRYPGVESDMLLSTNNYTHVTYSMFNKSKSLISNSKVRDNFSTHSLRRGGGTTAMRAAGVPLSHIKRGASGCQIVFSNILNPLCQIN